MTPLLCFGRGEYYSAMVDRPARDRLAQLLRHLAAGRITNDQFDDQAMAEYFGRSDDSALSDLAVFGWLHYSDHSTYKLQGRRALSHEAKREIARAILFLKSDEEYAHRDVVREGTMLARSARVGFLVALGVAVVVGYLTLVALTSFILGFVGTLLLAYACYWIANVFARIRARRRIKQSRTEETHWPYFDENALRDSRRWWPFGSRKAYEAALGRSPFLCGPTIH